MVHSRLKGRPKEVQCTSSNPIRGPLPWRPHGRVIKDSDLIPTALAVGQVNAGPLKPLGQNLGEQK